MRTFYIIALLLWIALSTFWSNRTFCGKNETKKPSAAKSSVAPTTTGDCNTSLLFEDGNMSLKSKSNFLFKTNGTKFVSPKGQLKETLTAVAAYLNENSDRSVLLEGLYFEKETNPSNKDNLGLGRAAALKTFLVDSYGIDASQILIGSQMTDNLQCYYNKDNNLLTKGVIATFGAK